MAKLSESILIGSVVVKAKPGTAYRRDEATGCAIGMAIVGAGGRWRRRKPGSPPSARTFALQLWWPWTTNLALLPCRCRSIPEMESVRQKIPIWKRWFSPRKLPIKEIIPHLFDQHVFGKRDWTLEQLAQWVASVEPRESMAARSTEKSKGEEGSLAVITGNSGGGPTGRRARLFNLLENLYADESQ